MVPGEKRGTFFARGLGYQDYAAAIRGLRERGNEPAETARLLCVSLPTLRDAERILGLPPRRAVKREIKRLDAAGAARAIELQAAGESVRGAARLLGVSCRQIEYAN